jgi:hypothetical protein
MNRYDVYDDRGREGEPIEEVDGTWVKYADYATVLSDCRWAMERLAYVSAATSETYQRVKAWLDAHKEQA